jgi:hypothetical protein
LRDAEKSTANPTWQLFPQRSRRLEISRADALGQVFLQNACHDRVSG